MKDGDNLIFKYMNSNLTGGQTYMSPAITEIEVNGEQILCTSFKSEGEDYNFFGKETGGMPWE